MSFERPLLLLLCIPTLALSFWFAYVQFAALREITKIIHPSKWNTLTSFIKLKPNGKTSYRSFWFFTLLSSASFVSIVISFAGPYSQSDSEFQTKQTSVYLVFDGSWSMDAPDCTKIEQYEYIPTFRFAEARYQAMKLNETLDDVALGVMTFAGEAVEHTHPSSDKAWIRRILFSEMSSHNTFYSGTNYEAVFQKLLKSSKFLGEGFQVVLYSDGDASEEEKNKAMEKVEMFVRLKIPIHVMAVGSDEGAEIELTFDTLDSVDSTGGGSGDAAGKTYKKSTNISVQKRKSIPDFVFLESIANKTGGTFIRMNEGFSTVSTLTNAILASKNKEQTLLWESSGKKSLAYYYFILPFLFFLYDFLWIRKAVKFEFK